MPKTKSAVQSRKKIQNQIENGKGFGLPLDLRLKMFSDIERTLAGAADGDKEADWA
jgi:hypothetical protein